MIHLVVMRNNTMGSQHVVGWTDDIHRAERYYELRTHKAEKSKNADVTFGIIHIPDEKFHELRNSGDNRFITASEIFKVDKDIYVSEDDYELIESSFNERVDNMYYHMRELNLTLSLFDDDECRELRKKINKLKKRFKKDYDGTDIMSCIDWERCIDKALI